MMSCLCLSCIQQCRSITVAQVCCHDCHGYATYIVQSIFTFMLACSCNTYSNVYLICGIFNFVVQYQYHSIQCCIQCCYFMATLWTCIS